MKTKKILKKKFKKLHIALSSVFVCVVGVAIYSLIGAIYTIQTDSDKSDAAVESNIYPFDTPGNYDYDTGKIEFISGRAQLKQQNVDFTDDTEAEFNTGTYNDTIWNTDHVELDNNEIESDADTIGLFHLNNSSGDVVDDSSYGNDGTNYGATRGASGQRSDAFEFDGSNDYVEVPDAAHLEGMAQFTMEAWIYPYSTGSEYMIVNKEHTYEMAVRSGTFQIALWTDVSGWTWLGTQAVPTNDWTHVAMVYDGSNMKVYIDGVYKEQFAKTGNVKVDTTDLRIGRRGGASYFHGKIDEVALYDTALDATTVAEHANEGLYMSSGDYTSQIFDAGSTLPWDEISWSEDLQAFSNWYDSNWSKRRSIEIDNSSNSNTLNNYQVKVAVTYDADMKNDFSDLRFADDDGTTLLDYFLASKTDGVSADVWVEVPTITASSTKDIYMYYGNSGASSLSNGANTMLFFDDYSSNTIANYTQTLFAAHGGGGPDFMVSGGNMTTGASNSCQGVYHTTFSSPSSVYIETYETGVNDNDGVGLMMRDSAGVVRTGFLTDEHQSPGGYKVHAGGDTFTMLSAASDGTTGFPTPHKIALAIDQNSNVYMWKDSTLVVNGYNDAGFTPQRVGLVSLANNPAPNYDYLFAKNYSYPEPVITVSGTESTEQATDVEVQVRSCDDAACDTETFIGPDGTGATYYTTPAGESLNVTDSQYFQYQINLTTTDSNVSPEVDSLTFDSNFYPIDLPTVTPTDSLQPPVVNGWVSFLETSAKPGGTDIYYQLSDDDGATWQYFDGGAWAAAGASDYNSASVVNANIGSFDYSSGKILFKAFLESDGIRTPRLDSIQIDYLSETYTFNGVNDWPFDVPVNYTYNDTYIDVVGSNAQLDSITTPIVDDTQAEFDNGTYTQTVWDTDHVELVTPHPASGSYSSDIFDAGSSVTWTDIAWDPGKPYCKELPDSEGVETGYNSGNADMSDNILLYHLNESSGIITDSSGNSNDGTNNGATYGVSGKLDDGMSFDGVNDYIAIQNHNYNASGEIDEITVCAWVKSSSANDQIILSYDRSEYFRFALKDDTGTGNVGWDTTDSTGTTHDLSTTTDYADGNWHYVCGWYDSGATPDKKIFVDGQSVLTANAHGGNDLGTGVTRYGLVGVGSEALVFDGTQLPVDYFAGSMDEVTIDHSALSDQEILDRYLRGSECLQFQVRSCNDPVCNTETFVGPDGTGATYYSEMNNSTLNSPDFSITNLGNNRYFQYKADFSTDNTTYSPELYEVQIDNSKLNYYNNSPIITAASSITPADVVEWNSFLETATKPSGSEIYYQISDDDGATWYWWNDLTWADVQDGYPAYTSNIALYRLNQLTGDVVDSSGNSNNGTNNGATRGVAGWFGNSFQFDGVDDYIEVPHASDLNLFDTDFSIEFWLKTTDANANLFKKYTGIAGGDAWGVRINSGVLEFYDGVSWISSDETVNDDTWKYVTITGDESARRVRFYIDADLKKIAMFNNLTTNALPLYIGKEVSGGYFAGQMDEIRISNVAYTESYILDHIWLYNPASEVDVNFESFPVDNSQLNFKAYLMSDGDDQVQLDLLRVGYKFGTNIVPVSSVPISITHDENTGYVNFQTTVQDNDLDDTKLKVEYSDDGGVSWYDPFLFSATPGSGSVDLDNGNAYQVGTIDNIDTSGGPVTLSVVWDTKSVNNGNGSLDNTDQDDIQLRVTANDLSVDGLAATTGSFTVDNVDDQGGQQGQQGGQQFVGGGGGGGGGGGNAGKPPEDDEEQGEGEEGEGEGEEGEGEGESDGLCDELTDIYGHWAEQYIYYLWQEGVVCGKTPGIFDPNYPISRAEFVKIILLALEYEIDYSLSGSIYADVFSSDWYYFYILTATNLDILQGYSDSYFRPHEFINRAEALKVLLLAAGLDVPDSGYADFPDIIHGSWYEKYVALAQALEIITGYENGFFAPDDPLTRAEACKIVYMLLGLI